MTASPCIYPITLPAAPELQRQAGAVLAQCMPGLWHEPAYPRCGAAGVGYVGIQQREENLDAPV
jgi:hypothetical protein